MISLSKWLRLRALGAKEAEDQLEKSKAEQLSARALNAEVRDLHRENHITARVHQAMRGGR